MFDSPAVKRLRKVSEQVGNMHGMVFMGDLSRTDLLDYVNNADCRRTLQDALAAARSDIGLQKAVKKAVWSARVTAQSYLFVRKVGGPQVKRVEEQAEHTLRTMLEIG